MKSEKPGGQPGSSHNHSTRSPGTVARLSDGDRSGWSDAQWEATRVAWLAAPLSPCSDAVTAAARTGWPLWVLCDPNVPLPDVEHVPVGLLQRRCQSRLDAGGFIRR